MNYAEREHAKVLRDEVTEDPWTVKLKAALHDSYTTLALSRYLTKQLIQSA